MSSQRKPRNTGFWIAVLFPVGACLGVVISVLFFPPNADLTDVDVPHGFVGDLVRSSPMAYNRVNGKSVVLNEAMNEVRDFRTRYRVRVSDLIVASKGYESTIIETAPNCVVCAKGSIVFFVGKNNLIEGITTLSEFDLARDELVELICGIDNDHSAIVKVP